MKKQIAQKIEKTKKPLRRILSAILALCVFCTALPFTAITVQAADDTTYTSGDYKYRILDDGTAEITDYTGSATNLTLPSRLDGYPVTSIGNGAFYGCHALESVTIPDSVLSIGNLAFHGCSALESITIPDGVTSIEDRTFQECYALESAVIPDSVTHIGDYAFSHCSALKSITIPGSVESIGYAAFEYCEVLKNVVLQDGITTIGSNAFYRCALENVVIPGSVSAMGSFVFCETNLKSVGLLDGVTGIGDYVFYSCGALESVSIPDSLTSIGSFAFFNCDALKSITIPSNVNYIGDGAFNWCDNLQSINVDSNNNSFCDIDGILFNKDKTELVICPIGKRLSTYVIPDSVQQIGDRAFEYHTALEQITFPNHLESIGGSAFFSCYSLDNVELPDSLTTIGSSAFFCCESLQSIAIPNGVERIETTTFSQCLALESTVLPESLIFIGLAAFGECDALKNVYYGGTDDDWNNIEIESVNEWLTNATIHYRSIGPGKSVEDLSNGAVTLYAYDKSAIEQETLASLGNTKLSGVTLTAGSKSEEFDEFVAITDERGTSQTVLSKPGYRDYIIPVDVMNSWFDAAQENGYLQRNTYLDKGPENDDPYVSAVFARSAGEGAYRDVMSQSFTASRGEKYDLVLSADLAGEENAAYYLWQDDEHMLMNSTGVFADWELASVFAPGADVYAYVETNSGKVSEREKLQLSITDLSLPKDEISLFGAEGQSATVDKNSDFLGGAKFSMDGFKVPFGAEITGNHFKFSFGIDLFKIKSEDGQTTADGVWKNFKKSVSSLKKSVSDSTDAMKEFNTFFKTFAPRQSYSSSGKNFDVSMLGYAEGNIIDGVPVVTDYCGEIALEFMFKYTQQGAFGPVPVYATIGGGAEISASPSRVVYTNDTRRWFDFGLTVGLEPKLELGAGLGIKKAVSIGLYGKGSAPMSLDFTDMHFLLKAKGELGIEGELFCFSGQIPLLKTEGDAITVLDKYFNRSSKRISYALPAFGESVTVQPAPSSGKAAYSVADRSYLKNMSDWLDGGVLKRLTRAVSASSPDEGVQMRELQTSVYKNSSTQLISLNDGRMMMAWIEDDPNRDDLNRMRLVYSVYSAGSWSEPKAVADDGTNDNTPVLATDGETVYIAWQNIKSKTTSADEAAVQQLLQDSEICLAKYNAEEDTFEPAVQLSDNALYDSTPAIAVENGNAAVYWVTATTNDMTQPGNNQIRCYTTADGKTQTVQDNVNNVLSMESAFVNGQPRLAYSADTDGDVSTTEDIETFVLDGSTAASVSAQDDIPDLYLDYGALDGEDVLFFADSTNIYYRQNGETKSVFTSPRAISGELQAVSDNSQTSLLWAESSEEGTDLWMCSYENGAWTEPVQLTSAGKYLHDVSAVYQDGQLCAVLDRTNRLPTEDGGYENGTTDLVYLTMTEYTEIEAGFAALDESQMELGQTYGVPVYIKNNGTKTVDTVKVTLNDGGLLPDVSKEIQVNLPSGADTVVYVDYPVPAEMVRTLFELSVEVVGETEQNTEDNTASQQIGYADISMQDMTVEDVGNYYILTAVLSNDNAVTAQGVQVNICAGSKDGDVLDTLTVGDMQPGDLKSVQYIVDKSTLEYGEEGMQQIYFCASIEQTLTRAANDAAELITEDNAAGAVLAYEEPQGPDEPGDVTLGDVDGNGTVNAADAVMVLRSDAGLTTLTAEQTAAADINGDGTVNASDAVQILRFDAGLIQVL